MIEEITKSLEQIAEKYEEINISNTTVAILFSTIFKKILDKFKENFPEKQNEFEKIVAEKLEKITGEKLTQPNSHIAISLLYLNAFTDSNQLRELFANLLVASMRNTTQSFAHVSFVRILEQMSPAEALLVKSTSILREHNPIARISYQKKGSDYAKILGVSSTGQIFDDNDLFFETNTCKETFHHITLFDIGLPYEQMSFLIDNLARLNLIEINYSGSAESESYKNFKRVNVMDNIMQKLIADGKAEEDYHLVYNAGVIVPTEYGKKFYEVCVK